MTSARPLVGPIDVALRGETSACDRVAPFLPTWTPAGEREPRRVVILGIEEGEPRTPQEFVVRHGLIEIGRDADGSLIVTAPGASALLLVEEVHLRYQADVSLECLHAVFSATWPLLLPRFGQYHVHGAAVRDRAGRGWLLAGDANVGKSTSTLALVSSGWHYAADDAVYLSDAAGGATVASGWAEPIRLTAGSAAALGVERERPGSELKSDARLDEERGQRRLDSLVVHRVLFPEFGGRTGSRPVGASDSLVRLMRASGWIAAQPEIAAPYLQFLAGVARLPARALVLGPELLDEPARLAEHLGELAKEGES